MPEQLTLEQITKAETMPLNELKELAIKEAEPPKTVTADGQVRDEKGKFASLDTQADVLDNKEELVEEKVEEVEEQVFRRVIENEDGSTDVYEAGSLAELVDKIAEGKRNANKQIKEFIAERKTQDQRTVQQKADDEYVVAERLKKEPHKTVREIVSEVLEERAGREQRSHAVQSRFVNTHPEYLATPENGNRLVAEYRRLNPGEDEFTSEGLEKAYLNLKRDGLVAIRKEASEATEEETKEAQGTPETKVEATPPRSPKGSTISTRSGPRSAPVNQGPTEDELYSMPLEKLRDLANKQLAENNRA